MTITGTSNFVSRRSAVMYYFDQMQCSSIAEAEEIVREKCFVLEIGIGKPRFDKEKGEKLMTSVDGRYFIESGN